MEMTTEEMLDILAPELPDYCVMDEDGVVDDHLPVCQFCKLAGRNVPARYDGRTVFGSWAYMCEECWRRFGVGLGLGEGQRLVLDDSEDWSR